MGGVNSLALVDITCQSASENGCDLRAAMSCSSVRRGVGEVMLRGLSSLVEVPSEDGIVMSWWAVLSKRKLEWMHVGSCHGETILCYLRNLNERSSGNRRAWGGGLRNGRKNERDEAGKQDEITSPRRLENGRGLGACYLLITYRK